MYKGCNQRSSRDSKMEPTRSHYTVHNRETDTEAQIKLDWVGAPLMQLFIIIPNKLLNK